MLSRAECSEEQINLELNINTAEEFREKFTLELTRVGFDDNYQLTTEGKLLEDLIDRFFISDV